MLRVAGLRMLGVAGLRMLGVAESRRLDPEVAVTSLQSRKDFGFQIIIQKKMAAISISGSRGVYKSWNMAAMITSEHGAYIRYYIHPAQ